MTEFNCNERCAGCALAREERLDEYECCSCGAKWGPEGVPNCPVIRNGKTCLEKEHHEGDHIFLIGRRAQCMFGTFSVTGAPRCEETCARVHEHGKMCFCADHLPDGLNDPCLARRSYNCTLWPCLLQRRHDGNHKDRNGEFGENTATYPVRQILAENDRLKEAIDQIAALPADHISKLPWSSIKVLTNAINESRNPGIRDAWIGEDDRPLPEDEEIKATFPTRSGRHDLYDEARRMVSARFTKGGLIGVINMLLHRIDKLKKEKR